MIKPGLYPLDEPRSTESRAEENIHLVMKRDLPDGWYAWHSLKIRDSDGQKGEGDFVIVDPDRGMVVLEVKGGHLKQMGGHWFQNEKKLKKTPLDQAEGYVRKLVSRLRAKNVRLPTWEVAAFFPDTNFMFPPSQNDLQDRLLGKQDLASFNDSLENLFSTILQNPKPTSSNLVQSLHDLWGDCWISHVPLGVKAQRFSDARIPLDERQFEVMEGWDEIDRLLIKGCAGSGKTLIASEAARRLAATGKKVLMLCFTEGLARWLKAQHIDTGVRVEPIRIFAKSILKNKSHSLPHAGSENLEWDKMAFEAAGVVEEKEDPDLLFDAVIVDEAQDLEIGDWELIRCLSGENKLWAFHDPKQQFWQDRKPDQSLFNTKINLKNNYRTPHSLMEVANSYGIIGDSTVSVQTALEEKTLDVICAPSPSSIVKKVELEIKKLRGDRFEAHRIAVLSLRGKSAEGSILKKLDLRDIDCYSVDEELADDHLIADTFLRFKGLERDAVIITDLCPDQTNYATRMHIALTRSLACARVITTREILRSDPVLSCILDAQEA
jgi:hypothetical protein